MPFNTQLEVREDNTGADQNMPIVIVSNSIAAMFFVFLYTSMYI